MNKTEPRFLKEQQRNEGKEHLNEQMNEGTNKWMKNTQSKETDRQTYLHPQFLQILSLPLLKSRRNYSKEYKLNNFIKLM